jgi:hypothetical protein
VPELDLPICDAGIRDFLGTVIKVDKHDNDLQVFLKERPFLSSPTLFHENGLQIEKLPSYLILVNPYTPSEIRFERSHTILNGSTTRL